jgi:hypothetical protein
MKNLTVISLDDKEEPSFDPSENVSPLLEKLYLKRMPTNALDVNKLIKEEPDFEQQRKKGTKFTSEYVKLRPVGFESQMLRPPIHASNE